MAGAPMEFHKKLQELRRQKNLTQEELAASLFVSRTAVSKWESGRGYPNIDSLKAIAKFYSVTIDELLSGDELLTIAEESHTQAKKYYHNLIFGLLDLSVAIFLFLPLFRQTADGILQAVSLISLTEISQWVKICYFACVVSMVLWGFLTLVLQKDAVPFWTNHKYPISLFFSVVAVLLFIVSLQPYAAALLFLFLAIKVFVLAKKQ